MRTEKNRYQMYLSVDEKTGKVSLTVDKKSLIEGLDLELNIGKKIWSVDKGNLILNNINEEQDEDKIGAYSEVSCIYNSSNEISGLKFVAKKHIRLYKNKPIVYFWLSNNLGKALFGSEEVARLKAQSVPGFNQGLYFVGLWPGKRENLFPHDVNRVINLRISDLKHLPKGGCFFLYEYVDGMLTVIIPLNGEGLRGWLAGEKGRLCLGSSSFDSTRCYQRIPLGIVYFGKNVYQLVEEAYKAAIALMDHPTRMRRDKPYPSIFEYLGWCSWEGFHTDITEEKILEVAKSLRAKHIPVKYFLIDAGWMSSKERKLCHFEADKKKFPGGLVHLARSLKKDWGIRWVGVWHTLQGYWNGIHPDSWLYQKYKEFFLKGSDGRIIPSPEKMKAFKFYHDWHQFLCRSGIDFVKVDNQTDLASITKDKFPLDEASKNLLHSLQASVSLHFKGMINCMAMGLQCAYHWIASNVTRDSEDYRANDPDKAKKHLIHSIYNGLWLGQLSYLDYDMFHSTDRYAKSYALSKAISGGPIYLSDPSGKTDAKLVNKLCLTDGRILRPDTPAVPSRDIIFADPYEKNIPLKACTQVGKVGLIAVFNVNKSSQKIEARVSSKDLISIPKDAEGYLVYQHFADKALRLNEEQELRVTLDELDCELFTFSPIKDGLAVIGLTDKFISPASVQKVTRHKDEIWVIVSEPGPFLAYVNAKDIIVWSNGKVLERSDILRPNSYTFAEGILRIRLPRHKEEELSECYIRIQIKD